MFDFYRFFFGFALWFFILGVSLWRGGRPERIVAITMLIGSLLTPLVQVRAPIHPEYGVLAVDLVVTAVILWIALTSDRWWPMFCTAYHFLAIGLHLVRLTRPDASQFAYATAAVIFAYLGLAALAIGVVALELERWRVSRLSKA